MTTRINIPVPELLLPDENLTKVDVYIAESSFIGGNYPSLLAILREG